MADGREGSQELMVEGGVAGHSVRQLSGKEGKGRTRLLHTLLEYPTHVYI